MELVENIQNIILPKEQERELYGYIFKELYFDPTSNNKPGQDAFYINKINEIMSMLKIQREKYSDNIEFYLAMATSFAQAYIPKMIEEYNITDENLIKRLLNIANGSNIKIFASKDAANKWIAEMSNGEESELHGDYGAFKKFDCICFAPDIEIQGSSISKDQSIINATRMLSSMIHETFHILIDVTKEEHFIYDSESKLTSGGSYLNEGLVEMHALDFSKRYNFIHLPALYYINNVEMCRNLKTLLGEEKFEQISMYGKYDEMLPTDLLQSYMTNERIRYYSRKGMDVDPANIVIEENKSKKL